MGGSEVTDPDFFVSYTGADRVWAEWIAWVLEEAGYQVLIQAWDFMPGSNWVTRMQDGVTRAARTIAVLSDDYARSVYGAAEWQAAWAADPDGQTRKLLVVRVADCAPPALLNQIVAVDAVGLDETGARTELLRAAARAVAGGRGKPLSAPPFPSAGRAIPAPVPFPRGLPAVWSLPWPRNPLFTGRDGELAALRSRLAGGDGSAVVLPQALHGLGGVGKTQLAVEYAYRYATDYDLVWWVPGESDVLAVAALVDLAVRVGVPAADTAEDQIRGLVEVLRRGEPFRRWLLVVDNAGAPSTLFGVLAVAGGGGQVLVTSRDPTWAGWAQAVEVDVLPRADAVRLLHRGCPRLTDAEAGRLAAAVGDLPLVLAQAGGWLATTGMPAESYERLLADRTGELLARGQPAGYPLPVAAAWTVAVDRLDDPGAVGLLRLLAHLGPEPVPLTLFTPADGPAGLSELLGAVAGDPLVFADRVARVCRLGLVRATVDGLVMHRLVQAVLRDHTPAEERARFRTAVHGLLTAADPGDPEDPGCWPHYAVLYPHVLAAGMLENTDAAGRGLVLRLGRALRSSGDSRTAARLSGQVYQRWATDLGEDHPDTLGAAANLAASLWSMGAYPAARQMDEDVLTRYRRILGEDHPNTLRAAANLAGSLWSMGEYPAARQMREDVLTRRRRILGEDHPATLGAAANLAASLWSMGEYPAARQLREDVLTRSRRILGEDHPATLHAAANLATSLRSMGEYPAARQIEEDVLTRYRRILGEDHPDTLGAAANLADSLWSMGEYPAARQMGEDVLTRSRRILGEDHPATLRAAANLAGSLWSMGEYPAARQMGEDVLTRSRRILGEDHPATLRAAANLATSLASMGEYPAARQMDEDVLTRSRRILGEDHPATLHAAANLATSLASMGEYPAARQMHEDVLTRSRRILGEDHPATLHAREALADLDTRDAGTAN